MRELNDIRCPEHRFRMFARVMKVEKETNLIEIKCRDCTKSYLKRRGEKVEVFHYYNILGEFIETRIINIPEKVKEEIRKDAKSALKKNEINISKKTKIKLIKKEEKNESSSNNNSRGV